MQTHTYYSELAHSSSAAQCCLQYKNNDNTLVSPHMSQCSLWMFLNNSFLQLVKSVSHRTHRILFYYSASA